MEADAKKEKLTDLVRNTFEILETQYRTAHDTDKIAKAYENELQIVVNLAFSSIQAIYDEVGPSDVEKTGGGPQGHQKHALCRR